MASEFPLGAVTLGGWLTRFASTNVVSPANAVDDAECLVEIEVFTGSSTGTVLRPNILGATPVGGFPLGSRLVSPSAILRYSDSGWIGEPTDADQPNVPYVGRATVPLQIDRDCPIVPEQSRRLQVQYGQVVITDPDGELDAALQGYAIAGRSVRVLRGPRSSSGIATPYASHDLVLSALATGWKQDEIRITIDLRDTAYRLDQPLQQDLYAGTGGAEGTDQWTGKPKPLAFGVCRNVAPDAIDPANNVYRVSSRQINAITALRDQGVALTNDGNYASYAALVAASISGGHAATCLAEGLIRTGSPTAVELTVDIQGDVVDAYVDTHASIARRILSDICGLSNAEFISSSFGRWPIGTAGVYFGSDQARSAADAIDVIAASVAGFWGPGRDGRIGAGKISDPDFQPIDLYLDATYLREPLQQVDEPAVPRYRQRVGYQGLQTVQGGGDLAGAVSAADRAYYGQAFRSVTAIDTDVQLAYPFAYDPPMLPTLFDSSTNAQTLADTLLGLYKRARRMFRASVGSIGFLLDLGSVVNLTYPRFGLASGKNFLVVGMTETAEDVILTLWG